jgi:acetyl-CoA carboxylase carboxyltransferase component
MSESTIPEDWRLLLQEFDRRVAAGRAMGGPEKLAKRAAQGRLNARELIAALVDADSFRELGTLVGGVSYHGEPTAAADALVGGIACIDGRPVVVACEDFTVMGGSIGHGTNAKKLRLANLALQEKIPYISVLEGSGERASNALTRYPYASNDLQILARLSGIVPTVCVVVGASAGHGALTGLMKDFVIMTETAAMFAAGPPLVEAASGEKVTKEELGGARMHAGVSGVCHNIVASEQEAFALVRKYLGFLPSNAWSVSPRRSDNAMTQRRSLPDILSAVPRDGRTAYDMRKVIELIADDATDLVEIQPLFGKSLLTYFARIGGYAVGVVANQPQILAGAITADAAEKAAHFLDVCNAYHVPVVFLADNPGVMSGSQAERAGTLRAAARMYSALSRLGAPKLHVTLRKAFGFGSSLMAMNPFDAQTVTYAFPGISLGGMPALGGGMAAKLTTDAHAQLLEAQQSGSWNAGDTMAYDEIIDPRELRNALLDGLLLCSERMKIPVTPVATTGIDP